MHLLFVKLVFFLTNEMPPKTKAQGTSKKADAKKKERVIEVSCTFLLAKYYK